MAGGANVVLDKGYKAGAAITSYRLVKMSDAETVIMSAAATDQSIGVCQEAATAGDATNGRVVNVRLMGISFCRAEGALATVGVPLRSTTAGRVQALAGTAGVNEVVVGILLSTAGTQDDLVAVLLTPGVRSNAATT